MPPASPEAFHRPLERHPELLRTAKTFGCHFDATAQAAAGSDCPASRWKVRPATKIQAVVKGLDCKSSVIGILGQAPESGRAQAGNDATSVDAASGRGLFITCGAVLMGANRNFLSCRSAATPE
ncbi:hypothetical protein [Rhodanobacter sp. MP7CTX1]|uniref:hypothetical protein n=1 Tax=Rhodanobacter sp. MP7CTX1 TaxID=2723084 RepID=UPI0016095685|nr:hypothetical protein [Rhodanobacter sp. MP7CTX1]